MFVKWFIDTKPPTFGYFYPNIGSNGSNIKIEYLHDTFLTFNYCSNGFYLFYSIIKYYTQKKVILFFKSERM